jgi:hypothetical protein
VSETAVAAQVVGRIDDGLDAQRPPVLQILFDPGVLVEGVDGDLGVAGDDLRLGHAVEFAGPAASGRTGEDEFHAVGTTDVEVVDDEGLETPAGAARGVEHESA